jgi:hypothetical protein
MELDRGTPLILGRWFSTLPKMLRPHHAPNWAAFFQNAVAAKHNNPKDKPVVLPESRETGILHVLSFTDHLLPIKLIQMT